MLKNSIRISGQTIFTILLLLSLAGCLGGGGGDSTIPPASTYSISGTVSGDVLQGVTITLSGTTSSTTTTDASGNYSFAGLLNGSYNVSPSLTGYAFYPLNTYVDISDANVSNVNFNASYIVDCSLSATYAPSTAPTITPSTVGASTTSVIVMHGKTGSPLSAHLPPLYTDLSNAGYDVIAPYMPWSGLVWDGSMCDAMNYIDSLAAQEAAKGRNVVVAGHSMGGAHALIYGVTTPSNEVKAIVTMAPGHFPHILTVMQTVTAPSIALAESMVASGNGDSLATFDIRLSGATIQITASANDYLSYHALYQHPDVNDVIPAIELPVLWLAGDSDPLTILIDMAGLASRLTNPDSDYQIVSGDHKTMVSSSGVPIDTWLKSLGI